MADQLPPVEADSIQWTEGTSKNGVPFKFGTKETENSTEMKSEAAMGEGGEVLAAWSKSSVSVWWPATGETQDRKLKATTEVPGITGYRLTDYLRPNHDPNWRYGLEFSNSRGWSFRFWDESGDSYNVLTIRNGHHFFLYNSNKPTIVSVDP